MKIKVLWLPTFLFLSPWSHSVVLSLWLRLQILYWNINRYGKSRQPYLVLVFSGISLSFSPFKLMWACYESLLLCLGMSLISLISLELLSWRVFNLSVISLNLMTWSYGFWLAVCLQGGFTFINLYVLNHPRSLDEVYLFMVDDSIYFWMRVEIILLRIFATMSIGKIGL